MTTVGYGEVVPRSTNEKIYTMAAMIIACGTFAYTVGSVSGIISKQSEDETLYRERAIAVNLYMKKNDLPYDLQFRVRRYLEYIWENQKNKLDEKHILSLLSEPLRDEIYSHIHGVVIQSWKTFEDLYDITFISQLAKTFEHETYAPFDIVLEEGEKTSVMYFITNGSVNIFHPSTNSSFRKLAAGQFFGELAFFTG
jgi:hyperpolarization activated cyclic nucleotide-gated potassium channel 2